MPGTKSGFLRYLFTAIILAFPGSQLVIAQDNIPRTPWGKPDLNGIWDFHHLTPLQRPAEFGDKAVLTPEEAIAYEAGAFDREEARRARGSNFVGVDLWHEEAFAGWKMDKGRTSLILDPPSGRLPPIVESRQQELQAARAERYRGPPRGPEDRSMAERCIVASQSVPPIKTLIENAILQIFQTPDHVAIHTERMHDSRIIPLDHRAPLPSHIKQYMGSSTGYWDGDTLVVETTNIHPSYSYQNSSDELQVIERFTRVSTNELLYEYTINDPLTFSQPWTAGYTMHKDKGPVIEYACHEHNYGLTGILSGARADEARQAGKEFTIPFDYSSNNYN